MRTIAKLIPLTVLSLLTVLPVQAHHSFSQFDDKVCVTISGEVRKFEFSYPHVWLWLNTVGADGKQVVYAFEGADPATLALYGWSPALLSKGEKVSVDYNPLRDGRTGGSMRNILLPSGKKIGTQGDEYVFAECVTSDAEEAKQS